MPRPRHAVVGCLVPGLLLFGAGASFATGFDLFQHGGRGTGQVGAFTARADEPSALTYNPAGIAALHGWQVQAGLDFFQGKDTYTSSTVGTSSAHHVINFPPHLYASWRGSGPFAFGIGIDSPFWYTQNWNTATFPGRFLNRRFELEVFELHPVVAYDLGAGWTLGAGLRYDNANLVQGDNQQAIAFLPGPAGQVPGPTVEVLREVDGRVSALSWDAGVRYATQVWGWGAVFRDKSNLTGSATAKYTPRDITATDPAVLAAINQQFARGGDADQSFLLPRQLRAGVWIAPYPELRLELDYAFENWSQIPDTRIDFRPDVLALPLPAPVPSKNTTARGWHNTHNLRFGLEGELSERWSLYGGVAYAPTPVPGGAREPQFPRGNAYVYAGGFSYNLPSISFDLAFGYASYSSAGANHQELLHPGVSGSYAADDRIAGGSIRWRF